MYKLFFPAYVFGVYNEPMGEPVGILAIDTEGMIRGALIDKDHRGIKYGHNWLSEIIDIVKQAYMEENYPFDYIRARTHKDNLAPAKVIADCGFIKVDTDGDFIVWEYKLNG